jgi:hypothetical protein
MTGSQKSLKMKSHFVVLTSLELLWISELKLGKSDVHVVTSIQDVAMKLPE